MNTLFDEKLMQSINETPVKKIDFLNCHSLKTIIIFYEDSNIRILQETSDKESYDEICIFSEYTKKFKKIINK